ncbi:hypothetical protein ACFSQE_07355 [Vogesella fluminis]|uniref:Uncharacterized protein n=1 Tax=Vogesella fluminis TaxID=1069161 RepID=A0ABQ3HBE4_9NEIS|nr:hypothetical protein [Vogesella fluminis]GHD80320.1 hypothetical protein GCM10011419_24850 [Vogesella fluminis]
MNSKTDVMVELAELQALEPYTEIVLPDTLPDDLRPSCTAMPIVLAERFLVLVPTGQEQETVERYMQSLCEQRMEPSMLERFQHVALGHAAICVAHGQRLWLPERLANWLGACSEVRLGPHGELRLLAKAHFTRPEA